MKKSVIVALLLSLACANAFAAYETVEEREAHRKEVKAVKDAQREARKNQPKEAQPHVPGFWDKEAERSGFSRMGHPGNVLESLNPMPFFKSQDEQFRARKTAASEKK